jgi:2-desacetyl-2-hydroxyethyl bacteriochlorophyllide A dehydrogenase
MKANAFWTVAAGHGEIRVEELPEPGPDQVLVRTIASGISRGTERLVWQGRVPESQWPVMRAPLQAGDFPFPVKYGYSAVGVVEAGPAALIGRRVFCLHPHQDRFVAPAALCQVVPDRVPDLRAVLAANMETAVNVLWDAQPRIGERVLVIGAGVVGLLVGFLLAHIPGIDLTVCDPDAARGAVAEKLGARFAAPEEAPQDCDLLIHASGTPEGLRQALLHAGFEARIVEASWFGDRDAPLPLGEGFHARRLSLVSSQVGAVAAPMRGRRTQAERQALALSLLGTDIHLDALLGPSVPFEGLPGVMGRLLEPVAPGRPAPLCPVVTY